VSVSELAGRLWSLVGGEQSTLDALTLTGDARVLPSVFDVTGFATACVGVAGLAAAELHAVRNGTDVDPVTVDAREASAAFTCEALFAPQGWERIGAWDAIAGDYRAADGWIRLHTNYANHRRAALRALDLDGADRDAVASAVAAWKTDDLEERVVELGGAAAAMHTLDTWSRHAHGSVVAAQEPVSITTRAPVAEGAPLAPCGRPLDGIKVLDLTRVIAGPFGTRFLAAWGADVLRIDPPGFEEVPGIVPESTAGKRCAFLDLASDDGRARFDELLHDADVVVHGFRPGALGALGLDAMHLRRRNPRLVVSEHDAYGWTGPWAHRRGFDSLVQMSCGIAAARGDDRPRPLPCQALDHGTGFLLAAAVCRALTLRHRTGAPSDVRGALIGAANVLVDRPVPDGMDQPPPTWSDADLEDRATAWGPARAVPIPGRIGDARPVLTVEPGPLGRHEPAFV
jgi:crotonobetainyl-CoA:carnitine CoA-transferase CaiB-like acyl-CoA transferase